MQTAISLIQGVPSPASPCFQWSLATSFRVPEQPFIRMHTHTMLANVMCSIQSVVSDHACCVVWHGKLVSTHHMLSSQVRLDEQLAQCQGLSIQDNWSDYGAVITNGSFINMPVSGLFAKTRAFDFDNLVCQYKARHADEPLVCEEATSPQPLLTPPKSKNLARGSQEKAFATPPTKVRKGI